MRKQKDNTQRIGALLLDALMLSFIVFWSLADVRIVEVYPSTSCTVTETNDDLILMRELDALCSSFFKQIAQAQPAHTQLFGSIFKSPLMEEARLLVATDAQYLYRVICTNTTINAP